MNARWLRWELPIIALLLLGGWLASQFISDPGYVLIAFQRFSLETSVWTAMALLLLGYLFTRFVFWLVPWLLRPRAAFRRWRQTRKATRARDGTEAGLLALANGDAARARKLLLASAAGAAAPLINHLSAARAAQQLGDVAARDADLARAAQIAPDATHTIALTRAQLLIDHGDWEDAHVQLQSLHADLPRNTLALQLLVRTSVRLRDGDALFAAMSALRKEKALPVEQLDALETEAVRWRFEAISDARGDPMQSWQGLSQALKQKPEVIVAYARALMASGNAKEAERLLREALDSAWHVALVRAYGETPGDATVQQLAVQRWLTKRANDAALLQTLGRIQMRAEHWSEARTTLEASLRAEQDPAASRRSEQLLNQIALRSPA